MDGDSVDLASLFKIAANYQDTYVILDEAHGLGISGKNNMGMAQNFLSHPSCLAKTILLTFLDHLYILLVHQNY